MRPASSLCRLAAACVLALLPATGFAAELRALYGNWAYDIAGQARESGRDYDFARDLELDTGSRTGGLIEWDTPRGLWPDLALGYQRVAADGDHEETTTITDPILGIPVTSVTRTIDTGADLTDSHLTARYPWRWGVLKLAGGLTLRRLEGNFTIADSDAGQSESQDYDQWIPQAHLQLRLPLKRVGALLAETDAVSYDGNRAVQWRAGLELRALAPLLAELSWQEKRYAVTVDDDRLDARLDGGLLRVGLLLR